jgi:site-specific DNA-cytosine methylase
VNILVACEYSGTVRDAFNSRGHDAVSVDLMPTKTVGPHFTGDVMDVINSQEFDMMIAFPPCTHLAVSGARYFAEKRADGRQQAALQFVRDLMDAPIPKIAIENPVSIISSHIRKPDQIIQPWQFGEDASKKTCLWLKNLPPLISTLVISKPLYANQTPSGQNKLGPSPTRAMERSKTYPGIAEAMANQWI